MGEPADLFHHDLEHRGSWGNVARRAAALCALTLVLGFAFAVLVANTLTLTLTLTLPLTPTLTLSLPLTRWPSASPTSRARRCAASIDGQIDRWADR